MIQREVTITNNSGLHARPATFFIQKANTYRSGVWVVKDDRKVSAKSLLGVLSIGIAKGMTITLVADGDDEEAAIKGLIELIESGFND
jgi:phosphocarrier protein